MSGLLSFEDSLSILLAHARVPAQTERVSLEAVLGRVLATDLRAARDVPPFDVSAMDGYAVRVGDVSSVPAELPVSARVAAGEVAAPIEPGTAVRIFTGAMMPRGADAVVMQEACEHADGKVRLCHQPLRGEWVSRVGDDQARGAVVLPAGTRLLAQHLGVAASTGCAALEVRRRLRVGVCTTGAELVEPGEPCPPGRIFNANRPMLRALLQGLGCEVRDLGRVPDEVVATADALAALGHSEDVVLTTGGVSEGETDAVKRAVARCGELAVWRIAMKPGKPVAFGRVGRAVFIGLPGNPVSAFVTFLMLVRPFLLACLGALALEPAAVVAVADFEWPAPDARREFLRARLDGQGRVSLYPDQRSNVLASTAWADGLVDNPPGRSVARGEPVRFIPFSSVLS